MNQTNVPEVVKQLKFNMEYANPPLPYIQVTRQAIKSGVAGDSNNSKVIESNKSTLSAGYSPRREMKAKLNVTTLDGILSSEAKQT